MHPVVGSAQDSKRSPQNMDQMWAWLNSRDPKASLLGALLGGCVVAPLLLWALGRDVRLETVAFMGFGLLIGSFMGMALRNS